MGDFEWAVKNGDLDQVRTFVEKDKSVVSKDVNGRFPLIVASDYGQTEIIDLLISKGADVNTSDKYGITPLLSAIYEGHTDSVKLLLQKGAKKTGKAPDGSSYLECAPSDDIKALLA